MEQFAQYIQNIPQMFSLDMFLRIVIIYFFIIWWALIVWVIKDITNRTTNLFVQVISILLVLVFTPIFGLPIYLLIRPRTTIFEKYYESAEFDLIENEEQSHTCFSCNAAIEKDFHFCPYCRIELRKICSGCEHLIQKNWGVCPYCWVDQKKEEEKKEKKQKKITTIKEVEWELEAEVAKEFEAEKMDDVEK